MGVFDTVKNFINGLKKYKEFANGVPTPLVPIIHKSKPFAFDKNKIIEDYEFTYNSNDSSFDIQKFLVEKKSFLASFKIDNVLTSEVIRNIAQKYNINPKLLLVSLEREQSLITAKTELREDGLYLKRSYETVWTKADKILKRAMGAGMTDGGDKPEYYGFGMQLISCAKIYNKWFGLASGKINLKYNCSDDPDVYPKNAATYSLYQYCPWTGSANFYQTRPVKDAAGAITGTKKILLYEKPFGNFFTWVLYHLWWSNIPWKTLMSLSGRP